MSVREPEGLAVGVFDSDSLTVPVCVVVCVPEELDRADGDVVAVGVHVPLGLLELSWMPANTVTGISQDEMSSLATPDW